MSKEPGYYCNPNHYPKGIKHCFHHSCVRPSCLAFQYRVKVEGPAHWLTMGSCECKHCNPKVTNQMPKIARNYREACQIEDQAYEEKRDREDR